MTVQNQPLTPDDLVRRLVQIAREEREGGLSAREQAGVYRLERALLPIHATPRATGWARWLLLPATLGAAAGMYALRHERALTFEVVRAQVADGGYISSGAPDGAVRFSDHSDLMLEAGTRLRISHLEVRGANVMLEGGKMHVRIHPLPRNHWTLDAGPYLVHVTGTEFDLAWRVEEQTLDLRLYKGSVIVEGPLVAGGVKLNAGQHLVANANAGMLSLSDEVGLGSLATEAQAPRAAPAVALAALATPGSNHAPPVSAGRSVAMVATARAEEPNWGARVARGDFDGVVEDAERRGIDRALRESSPVDLAALADAARYARRQEVAERALMAERTRYPDSLQARDAAFFLGGLAEPKSSTAALDWYHRYLRESPSGAYASQALGREVMLVHRLQGESAARSIATEYVARFPDGPYAPSARKLLQER